MFKFRQEVKSNIAEIWKEIEGLLQVAKDNGSRVVQANDELAELRRATVSLETNSEVHSKDIKGVLTILKETTEKLAEAEATINRLVERMQDYDEMFEDYESLSIEKTLAKKSSSPWAGFSVTDVDKNGRIALKLDWNDQFIEHLRRNGINAPNEEEIVGVWFASLMKEMGEEITEEQAEEYRKTHRLNE